MQLLMDKCIKFGDLWKIKFNPRKSSSLCFGNPKVLVKQFRLGNENINITDIVKILGYKLDSTSFQNNNFIHEQFNKVRKSFFSLYTFGMKPNGLNIHLQAYIYKTFCVSRMQYALENMSIDKKT